MSDNIKVVVKVRPLISREIEDKLSYQWRVKNNTLYQLDQNGKDLGQSFTFDKVYDKDTKTSDVYNDIAKPIVEAATAGFNGTIFAYGQTSSGKTYTMTGTDGSLGIIQLAVLNLFEIIKNVPDRDFLVRVSYIEIYNETVKDLLNVDKENIKVQDTPQGIKVDATEKVTSSPEDILQAMKEGEANRQKGATNMNEQSSRSHSIFQIIIESREHIEGEEEAGSVNVSQLNLVDLAGSERSGQTGATGKRFIEGTHINKSLSVLALVIKQLSEGPNKHANYRDSKLTRILQNSLGGNAKTSIICAVTPAAVEETISTLQFANRAKAIKNKPEVNAVATDKTMIQRLTKRMCHLQAQLENKKNIEQVNHILQDKIAKLRKVILNGFAQRSSMDLAGGARRKLQPPRRITISTLPSIDDDPVIPIPKFCTPSVKYNPMLIPSGEDLARTQSVGQLASVPEEPARMATPPRTAPRPSDEVIELDSDDDSTKDDKQTCSPIHKCYASKTPPCILRRNAQVAEANLKDLVELTDREKVYTPSVVEYIEKLEQNTNVIANLEEQINLLTKQGEEKDLELDRLRRQINKTEEDMKTLSLAQMDLRTQCENYKTKLIDVEVSFETLRNKAKLREEELLSLLEEQINKNKKPEAIGKVLSRTLDKDIDFMDMSKDISLVNSDNESNSVIATEEDHLHDIVTETQTEINLRNQTLAQQHKALALEKLNHELQEEVMAFNEKLTRMETENSLLKSTIETLNVTIKGQRENLATANQDIDSYNSTIQELQIQISRKETIPKININDNVLESMIANEENFIASNENIKNIIISLRNALDIRNKEIDKLQTTLQDNKELILINSTLTKQLEAVELEISSFRDKKIELEQINKEMKDEISKLSLSIADKSSSENKITQQNEQLLKRIEDMNTKITVLEIEIKEKDDLIFSLKDEDKKSKENLQQAKAAVVKLQHIVGIFTGDMREMPKIIDNFVNILSALSDSINILENVANDIVTQKNESMKTNANLKILLDEMTMKHNSEISELQERENRLSESVTKSDQENKQLIKEIQIIRNELDTKKYENETLRDRLESGLKDLNEEKDELLNSIYRKITDFTSNFNIQNDVEVEIENDCRKIYQIILLTLDKIGNHIILLDQKNLDTDKIISEILLETQKETASLSQKNSQLLEQLYEFETKNSQMLCEVKTIKDDNQILNKELLRSQGILQSIQMELKIKADELAHMEDKVKEWKDQFTELDRLMKQKMNELKLDNENLKARIASGENTVITYEHKDSYGLDNQELEMKKQLSDLSVCGKISSPPSLVTICCNKIEKYIHPRDADSKSTTMSSSVEVSESNETYTIECKCSQLSTELETAWQEHSRTMDLLQQMKSVNHNLIEEQEAVRSEIQLLIALAQTLQKRLDHHRTNLSILTTTTYAENMYLKSQVNVIQHHLNRFQNLCKRDLPDFKSQLLELMNLLHSITDQQNANLKRVSLPDVLDCSTALPNFKNESILDGDLLMLDTNITMTTSADNTLSGGHDQTCLDLNQYYSETKELNRKTDQNISDIEILSHDNQSMYERINILKSENEKLREIVEKYTESKVSCSDTLRCSIETCNDVNENSNNKLTNNDVVGVLNESQKVIVDDDQNILNDELESLKLELLDIKSQKDNIEHKYNNLLLETPSTDKLVQKLSTVEKDCNNKVKEIAVLTQKLKNVQEENDSLSTQVMENITEADNLNKELNMLKENNRELLLKCSNLEESIKKLADNQESVDTVFSCSECLAKDELITMMQKRLTLTHKKLNRSLSDSDTTSRYNKICTLQSELHAGREDCKELTEDVVTIKNHLEKSNLSMDLDYSMGESNNDTFAKDFEISSLQSKECNMCDIPEERPSDNTYVMDKTDCFKFYIEKTGRGKDNLSRDVKIIEIMKMFYEYLITEHGKEEENLTNKLKEYDESKNHLQLQYNMLMEKHSQVTTELKRNEQNYSTVSKVFSQIKNNIDVLNQEIINVTDIDVIKLVNMYNENFFKVLDNELGLSSVNIFKSLIDNIIKKHESDLDMIMKANTHLQKDAKNVTEQLHSVNENLIKLKGELSTKENEYNLLKKQKEMLHEINNAVTLDIVKKDNDLTETTRKLEELEKEKETLISDVKYQKQIVAVKQKEIEELQIRSQKLQEINKCITLDLMDKNNNLQAQQECNKDLNNLYESKVKENQANIDLIEKLSEEIILLKATIEDKERFIVKLEKELSNEKDVMSELLETVKGLKGEVSHLKAIQEVITMEKDAYANELIKSGETIKQNNIEMDKMTSDILILKESGRENEIVIEKLNVEIKNLMKDNMQLKEELEGKLKECCRLETNIKTHEKTAEIQTRMITRLEKQKDADDKTMSEKTKQIEELTHKCDLLQKQCDTQHTGAKEDDELKQMRTTKETLEARISELEELLETKSRLLIDAISDSSRKRRQSLHDSKRMFAEDKHDIEDQNNVEAMFASRPKPDDLFMDVEEDVSIRSSPIRMSKGRESLSLSRTDQSDKDEEHPSRPSSVLAARRRRQSIHDLHRSVLRHTPSPHGLDSSNRTINDLNHSKPCNTSGGNDSELSQLRERLATCQQELEDLKERYKELDDECETCSEYLRERDAQCARLKKEKTALQETITELKEKINNPSLIQETTSKPCVAHVAINTDEDWTNLHSVVVDRMSYDAEVEKNKRLTKTIEELRYTKQDLKNTIAKMQKALERTNESRKQDTIKAELQACKQELVQLRQRYKELDEECETCAQYLRDREEQCRKLKEAKAALEAKLQDVQKDHITAHSTRKKRQSLHDQNRGSTADDTLRDAATEISDELLSYQVERDGTFRNSSEDLQTKEIQLLQATVEKLSHHKAMLEQQLASVSTSMHMPLPAMYVATGSAIVQNQQLSDVMKENQKLKKMNAKLVSICKKRGKDSNRENEDPSNKD